MTTLQATFLIGANMPHVFKSSPEYFVSNSGKEVKALTIFFNAKGKFTHIFNLPEMKQYGTFIQQQMKQTFSASKQVIRNH